MNPPPILAQDVAFELGTERVVWADSPDRWAYGNRQLKTAWVGIPFTAFAVFWTWAASGGLSHGKGAPMFFILWGVMFICVGLSIMLSPLFSAWKAGRMYYALTEKRAVIFERVVRTRIRSFDASGLAGFERVSRGDGEGDIIFQRNVVRSGRGTRVTEVGFLGLTDYRAAETALRGVLALREKKSQQGD